MAINIIVAIGGTGSRVAEAYVYAAATGLLENNTKTHIFIVDKDIDCGNTQRLGKTIDEYNDMRLCTGLSMPEIEKHNWCIKEAMEELKPGITIHSRFRDAAVDPTSTTDALLVDLMHSEKEQTFDLGYGFYGHPSLGAAIYGLITKTNVFGNMDTNKLLHVIRAELAGGQDVQVFLMGSVFGGTGASLFPNVARSLEERFGRNPHFRQGGGLMLPYFTFKTKAGGTVSPEEFLYKTATALHYYALDDQQAAATPGKVRLLRVDNRQRGSAGHNAAVFDALYLLGLTPLEPTCNVFEEGGPNQVHSFSIADLYGALSAVEFFNGRTLAPREGMPWLYTADMPQPVINWPQVPNLEIRAKAEQLVRFCEAFLAVLYPMFLQPKDVLQDYLVLQHLFGAHRVWIHSVADLPEGFDFDKEVDRIAPFCLHYLCFWRDLHNNPNRTKLFSDTLRAFILEVSENDGYTPQEHDWFKEHYRELRTTHFRPDDLLVQQRASGQAHVTDAMGLQGGLEKYDLDIANFHELQPIYRAAYDLMK